MTGPATSVTVDRVAVITLDNPPVNALSHALRAGLLAELEAALADPAIDATVIHCAGRTFVAGADITEFGRPIAQPGFPELFSAIEDSAKPVIAAIHGTSLGGGFELSLACHYRVAVPSARVGLPEVKLGILPGAGGTQRLPRLVGACAALEIMTSGRQVKAEEALAIGLLDAVLPGQDLVMEAVAFARNVVAEGARTPRVRDREDMLEVDRKDPELVDRFFIKNAHRFRGLDAPTAIGAAVRAALSLPFEEGLAHEQQLCLALAEGHQSEALRYLFFAERQTTRVPDLPPNTAQRPVASIGVIGAGTMGGGITMTFLDAGLPVTLVETSKAALERGCSNIRRHYEASAQKGRMSADEVETRMSLLSPRLDLTALRDADFVIEAVFEDLALKRDLFAQLDALAAPDAILASNTSFLDLDAIADATSQPERVLGLHFFSPVNVMRLVEVVRTTRTKPENVATAMSLARKIGKVPVLSAVCDGFIANRLMAPRGAEAEIMMLEGIPIERIDKVLTDYGFGIGHFQMMDMVGLDVVGRGASERTVMGDLVAAGRLGLKSGSGYYDYDGKHRPLPSKLTETTIAAVAREKGVIGSDQVSDEELLTRLLCPVVNEGAHILEEGIALRASDIDVAAVLGYNWPAHTGGPMAWAEHYGLARIVESLRKLEAMHGARFKPARLLVGLAKDDKDFAEAQVRPLTT